MRVAITGATGLIGQKIVEELSRKGLSLTCLSRREQGIAQKDIEWQSGDLAADGVAETLVAGQDVVIHLAHGTIPLSVAADTLDGLQAGIAPTLKLIAAVKKCTTPPRIIYLSSGGAIYGEAAVAMQLSRETDRCEPLTEYGIQKLLIERYLHGMTRVGDIQCTVLRVSNAYGALLDANRMQGLIGTSVTRMLRGQSLRLIGDPHNVRDYVHVTDIAAAVGSALQHFGNFGIFNIGSGVGYSVLEVMDMITRIGGGSSPVELQEVRGSNLLANRNVLDIAKARLELGWSPTISLEAGIRSMFEAASEK